MENQYQTRTKQVQKILEMGVVFRGISVGLAILQHQRLEKCDLRSNFIPSLVE